MLNTEEVDRMAEEALAEFETPPLPGMEETDKLVEEALAEAKLDREIDELANELRDY